MNAQATQWRWCSERAQVEEGSGPHWPGDFGLRLAWGRGVPGDVVVDEAELYGVLERPADDRVDVPHGPHGQIPLVLRRLFGATDDRCNGVLAEGLPLGELLGEFVGNRPVADTLGSEVLDAGVDLRVVSPVRRVVDRDLLLLEVSVQIVEMDRAKLLEFDAADPGENVDPHVALVRLDSGAFQLIFELGSHSRFT